MVTKSIRWRLQMWQGFLLLCVLTGFGVTAYQLHCKNRKAEVDLQLSERLDALAMDVWGRLPSPDGRNRGPLIGPGSTNFSPFRFGPGPSDRGPGSTNFGPSRFGPGPLDRGPGDRPFGEGPKPPFARPGSTNFSPSPSGLDSTNVGPFRPGSGPPDRRLGEPPPEGWTGDHPPMGGPSGDHDPGRFQPPPGGPMSGPGLGRFGPDQFLLFREIRLSALTTNRFSDTSTNGFFYAIWRRNPGKEEPRIETLLQSTNVPGDLRRLQLSTLFKGVAVQTIDWRDYRVVCQSKRDEYVLVGRSMAKDYAEMQHYCWLLLAAGAGVLLGGLGGGWILTGRTLRPIADISSTASRISAGNLAERINVAETDNELGKLASVLNSTFARLETAFAQQKQFTADASHELRTPLAVMISEAQSTLARERNAAEYRESLQTCLETAQEMKRLAQRLLELAALDAGQQTLQRHVFDFSELVRSGVETIATLARDRGIEVTADLPMAEVFGDPDRLVQVVANLLTNAVQYTREGGKITVAVTSNAVESVLKVSDTGIGIAPEDLPHVFDRFFRSDKARTLSKNHTGLGLAIVKAIVKAHDGTISVESQPGVGSTFAVRLPARSNRETAH